MIEHPYLLTLYVLFGLFMTYAVKFNEQRAYKRWYTALFVIVSWLPLLIITLICADYCKIGNRYLWDRRK